MSALVAKLLGFCAAAALVAAVSGYVTHHFDSARYNALVAADAKALADARRKDLVALEAFAAKSKSAENAAAQTLAAQRAAAEKKSQALSADLARNGERDATLANCLRLKLPADVLRDLAH